MDDFCKLPKDTKEVYLRKGPDNHGYVQPGQEKFDGVTPELRHAFNICTLNAANLPEQPLPGFREHIGDLATDFKTLSGLLLQALAIGLGELNKRRMRPFFQQLSSFDSIFIQFVFVFLYMQN